MADHVPADVRGTALRAVQNRAGPFDPREGEAGAQRRTQFAGVARGTNGERSVARCGCVGGSAITATAPSSSGNGRGAVSTATVDSGLDIPGMLRAGSASRRIQRGSTFSRRDAACSIDEAVAETPSQTPHGAHHRSVDFAGEVQHACETGQALLPLVVMVAESNAQLVGDGTFLDAADEQIDLFFLDELGQLQRVGVVDQDRVFVAQFLEQSVVLRLPVCEPARTVFMPSVRSERTNEKALKAPPV